MAGRLWLLALTLAIAACSAPSPPPPPPPPPPPEAVEPPPPPPPPRPSPPPRETGTRPGGEGATIEMPGSREEQLPAFALPAPAPSARMNLARSLFGSPATLGDINRAIETNLRGQAYPDGSYYRVPGGFALVTAIERIKPDGTRFTNPDRWKLAAPPLLTDFSLSTLMRQLRTADPGHYRVLVFLVTTSTVTVGSATATFDRAQGWLTGGGDFLPAALAATRLTPQHNISVLIYEFARPSIGAEPRQDSSGLTAEQHLRAARLLR